MSTSPYTAITAADTAPDTEFGSTRIKVVLVGPDHEVLATDGHGWENRLKGDLWSYTLDEIVIGLRTTYTPLVIDVRKHYDVIPTSCDSIGISMVMHGYLAFDVEGGPLVPFRMWRNTGTGHAADGLTRPFGLNIPLRWSIAHPHQTVLDSEEHMPRVARLMTLAGWVRRQLTRRYVLGVGDALSTSSIDSETSTYMKSYLNQHGVLVETQVPRRLHDVLPTVSSAGKDAGTPTPEGAALIDPTGTLQAGIALYPPEDDTGIDMIATSTIVQRMGNIPRDTPIFLTTVLERSLTELHTEIDAVTTSDSSPVAMIRSNSGAPELDARVDWFTDFTHLVGADMSVPAIYGALYSHVLTDEIDASGAMTYNTLSVRPLIDQEVTQLILTHTVDACASLVGVVRAQLVNIFAAIHIGVDTLRGESVHLNSLFAHGDPFKTPSAIQQILADSLDIPASAGDTAGEGGAWGIAILIRYRTVLVEGETAPTLPDYLSEWVSMGVLVPTLEPTREGVTKYGHFLDACRVALSGVEIITRGPARRRGMGQGEWTGSPSPHLVDRVKSATAIPMGKIGRRRKVTDPAKLKAYCPLIPFVARPYEGLPREIELIAMHELVPMAAMTTHTDADHGAIEFGFVTLLSEGHPAMVRPDGRILAALQTCSNSANLSHDAGATSLAAIAARKTVSEGVIPVGVREPSECPQDIVDIDSFTDMRLGEDLSLWFNPAEEIDNQTRRALEQNRDKIVPTEPMPGVPSACWCETSRNLVRFLTDNDETKLFGALARLATHSEANIGEGSRYVGSFHVYGLIVPVLELPGSASVTDVAPGTQALIKALKEAFKVIERLDDEERRARQDLVSRAVTIR